LSHFEVIDYFLLNNTDRRRQDGETQNDPISLTKRSALVFFGELPIYVASATKEFDHIARFQFDESSMILWSEQP